MISTGLSAANDKVFREGLLHDHGFHVDVDLLDLNHNVVASVDKRVTGGQVDVDSSQDTERSCSVEIEDPRNSLNLVSSSPTDAPIYANLFIRIWYCVKVPGLDWVRIPVFTGPITDASMDNGTVTITGQGKESLLLAGTSRTYSYGTDWKRTDVISNVLSLNGEAFRRVTPWSARLASQLSIGADDAPWPVLKTIARGLVSDSSNYPWLGYNGLGYAVLQSHSKTVKWFFTADSGSLVGNPVLKQDMSDVANFVVVTDSNNATLATARAAKSNPLSAESLARNGVPRLIRDVVQMDGSDKAAATTLAKSTLQSKLDSAISVSFDCLPVPMLEPRDVVNVNPGVWSWNMQVNKFTLPLTGEAMSIGRNNTVMPSRRRK